MQLNIIYNYVLIDMMIYSMIWIKMNEIKYDVKMIESSLARPLQTIAITAH